MHAGCPGRLKQKFKNTACLRFMTTNPGRTSGTPPYNNKIILKQACFMYLRPLLGSGMPDAFRLSHHPVPKVIHK